MGIVKTETEITGVPKAVGPYSVCARAHGTLYISGQIGIDPNNGEMQQGVVAQARQLLANAEKVLQFHEVSWRNVCKTTIFLTSMDDFQKVNEVYGGVFLDHKPARSTVAVAALPLGALVEIEFIVAL